MVLVLVTLMRIPVLAVGNTGSADTSTFLGSNAHTGYNGSETIINSATASKLGLLWTAQTASHVTDQVLSVNGVLYWGSWDGLMHATDPATGRDIWATNIGTKPGSCSQVYGIVGSATVATVPINGVATSVVFVAGGQDNLNALDASTGQILWQTNLGNDPAAFLYSSTTVYNGSVYVGVSSFGDCPLVQGQVVQVDASTGQIQNTFDTVPDGCIGVGIWGSISIDDATGKMYFGTGNSSGKVCVGSEPLGQSIVELNAADLSFVASWPVSASDAKPDEDFGSTPTLFPATINGTSYAMLGMVNKNGYYYALDRNNIAAGALWKTRISVGGADPYSRGSIPVSAYDGTTLYVAGTLTTIQGQQCAGSLRALDPNTGTIKWELCLSSFVVAPVVATPQLVVVSWGNTMGVVDSATGTILYSYQDNSVNANFDAAATFSDGVLYIGSRSGKVFSFTLQDKPILAQDTFQRANQAYWGTASDGQAWTGNAKSSSAFSINGNVGQIVGSANNTYSALLGPTATNAEAVFSGSISSFSNGSTNMAAVLRWTDRNNFYKAYIDGKHLIMLKMANGSITRIASTSFAATPAISYTLRFNIVGTTLSAKVWQTGTTEPGAWMVTATDATFSSGKCGLYVHLLTGVSVGITSFQVTAQ